MASNNKNARPADLFGDAQQDGHDIEEKRESALPYAGHYTSSDVEALPSSAAYSHTEVKIPVTLDTVFCKVKPQKPDYGTITNRLKQLGPTTCTPQEFCNHVKNGGTWVGAVYDPSGQGWGRFVGQRLFGLDFDNKSGSTPLAPGDPGYLDPLEALRRCKKLGIDPLCLYFTMSARLDWPRFRLVFDMGELVDDEVLATALIETLLGEFPEADQSCRKPNRIFLGSQGEIWECWQVWGGHDV